MWALRSIPKQYRWVSMRTVGPVSLLCYVLSPPLFSILTHAWHLVAQVCSLLSASPSLTSVPHSSLNL